jgi:hypothetical protein
LGSFAKAAAAAFLLALPCAALAGGVWFSSGESLFRLDPSSDEAALVASPGAVSAIAVNSRDDNVWVLVGSRLRRYDAGGIARVDIDLKNAGVQNPSELVLNPVDGSLWITDGKTLLHLGEEGQTLNNVQAPGVVRALALSLDATSWVLGNKRIWRISSDGALLANQDLTGLVAEEPKFVAADALGDALWLAGEKQLSQSRLSNPGQIIGTLDFSRVIASLVLDQKRGLAWTLSQDRLTAITRDGQISKVVELGALGLDGATALAFDGASDSLWLAHPSGLARLSSNGNPIARIAMAAGVSALGVAPFSLVPSVSIVRPPTNALTNNPRPEFRLAYDALCSGISCGFSPSYFVTYSLSAVLNGQAVGSLFTFDGTIGQSSFTPSARLPEGSNTFSASVQDRFGRQSELATSAFTVDTIAPRFLTLRPADGATVSTPNVVIQGTIDDPSATVVLASSGSSQRGTSFSFPVVLQPGLNTFTLTAVDPAGNASTATLRLTLSALTVGISSPLNGASLSADHVAVSGTFQGPANSGITVNGVVASIRGNTFIVPSVPLQAGVNTISATVSATNQGSATQSVTVTSSGPAPMDVVAGPAQGIGPLTITFTVNNRTGNAITSIQADFLGTGFFINIGTNPQISRVFTAPGTFQANFIITDSTGATFRPSAVYVIDDATQIDQTLRSIWSGFMRALSAGDASQAAQYFNAGAQRKYGPVLSRLQPNLPGIVASFTAPQVASVSSDLGEYVVGRTINGVKQIFFIYFLRDVDGVWRLDSM